MRLSLAGLDGLARGAVVHGPREFVSLGRGESGPELVTPLSRTNPDDMERCETCGLGFTVDPFHFDCPDNDPNAWGPLPAAAISAELVACTLGQRRPADRLELRVDLLGKVLHAAQVIRRSVTRARFVLH
jgi:hypothetical protein